VLKSEFVYRTREIDEIASKKHYTFIIPCENSIKPLTASPAITGALWCSILLVTKGRLLLLLICVSITIISQEAASSSAVCSRHKLPFSFVRGQDSTIGVILHE